MLLEFFHSWLWWLQWCQVKLHVLPAPFLQMETNSLAATHREGERLQHYFGAPQQGELLLKMKTAYFHLTDVQFVKCAWPCPIKLAFHSRQLVERIARALLHCSLAGSLVEHFGSKRQARVRRFRIMACLKPLGFYGLMLLFIYLFLNFFLSFFFFFYCGLFPCSDRTKSNSGLDNLLLIQLYFMILFLLVPRSPVI